MSLRTIVFFISVTCSQLLWSFNCYFTLAKDSCWTPYNITVTVLDTQTNSTLATVVVPPGKSWARESFTCHTDQKLFYKAQFNPVFWESDVGKSFLAKNYWILPSAINAGDSAWNLSVCYPNDFSEIPLPPDAVGNCQCNFAEIPALKPQ